MLWSALLDTLECRKEFPLLIQTFILDCESDLYHVTVITALLLSSSPPFLFISLHLFSGVVKLFQSNQKIELSFGPMAADMNPKAPARVVFSFFQG